MDHALVRKQTITCTIVSECSCDCCEFLIEVVARTTSRKIDKVHHSGLTLMINSFEKRNMEEWRSEKDDG
ncbi:hypothetical protein NECAME_09998 [Necator americanus]|uniref:Uncharacterized protein n=1 Tax=Necator americanus TaxID=51031 RepID=W2TAR4_NECAM|nr:hypothetical protein NECAME_09998 [Necator americanus]ETN79130.1 hypothetical protein NECAME_09998 [Necator americanus]